MMALKRNLCRDDSGVTVVEFALVAPVLLTMLLGTLDMGYNIYTSTILDGAIQQAARASTIEGSALRKDKIDARVSQAVGRIVADPQITFSRKAYASFSDVNRPEDFTDANGNGLCDDGEPFEDANRSGAWDNDRGSAGQGGARDAVLYTVTVGYPRLFAAATIIGLPERVNLVSSTVLRNQPYDLQNNVPTTGNCT